MFVGLEGSGLGGTSMEKRFPKPQTLNQGQKYLKVVFGLSCRPGGG